MEVGGDPNLISPGVNRPAYMVCFDFVCNDCVRYDCVRYDCVCYDCDGLKF